MPRAIIFDLFCTLLYDEHTGTRDRAAKLIEAAGLSEQEWMDGWRVAGDAAARGKPGTTRGRVLQALAEAGYQGADEHLVDELTGLLFARHIPFLYPDTRPTLAELRARGYRLGLVSNCFGDETLWPREFELDGCFDAMLFSCDVGMVKPEPGIYRRGADQLDVAPAECVFVDDTPIYVAGAMAVGMTGVRINRFESERPYAEHRIPATEPDLKIRELRELLEWLDGGLEG